MSCARPRHPTRPLHGARLLAGLAMALAALAGGPARSQERPDPAALLATQRDAMQALARMDGLWRGPAWTLTANGNRHEITQTERIGPLLGGAVKLIEGRGYEADGRVSFNAIAVVSYDIRRNSYVLQSHAQGQAGTFALTPTADGYSWTIPTGGESMIRYTAVIRDGELHEVGDRLLPGQAPQRFFEMKLKRIGDSGWPEAGAVAPR